MKRTIVSLLVFISVITAFYGLSARAVNAQTSAASDSAIMEKLDEVLANQKVIREEISSLREDLNIVKLRVSQNQ